MARISRYLSVVVLLLGLVGIVVGGVFLVQGISKSNWMSAAMQQEKVTLGLDQSAIDKGEVIDTASEAQKAGDTIRGHRHSIAPNYNELLGGGKYDPTNPKQLTYAQAMNMENYLYLAVLGFGVTQVVIGSGAFMIVTGLALIFTGAVLFRLTKKQQIKNVSA